MLWLAVAGLTGSVELKTQWHGADDGILPLMKEVRTRSDLCGLGFYGPNFPWNSTGGYTYLDRPVPLYPLRSPKALADARPVMNYLLIDGSLEAILPTYKRIACAGDFCLMRHDQPCVPAPRYAIDSVLAREHVERRAWLR